MRNSKDLGLADAIEELRNELQTAQANAVGAGVQLPIQSVSVELQLVVTKEGQGKAGFKVPVIDLELGVEGGYGREATHKVVIEFGPPVDGDGEPVRVERLSEVPLD
ncbi:trypco2 family protein [Kribbella sp. NPDC004138]